MHPKFGHVLGRLFCLLPNTTRIKTANVNAQFFLPIFTHHVGKDLCKLRRGRREPALYDWIESFDDGSVFFDVGTHYGQEVVWASCLDDKSITVIGFDCGLLPAHCCAVNRVLNKQAFELVFAAVGDRTGDPITITANSDTHIPRLHRKNVPYSYQVISLALDDFVQHRKLSPTHLKIDVDGHERAVIDGEQSLLSGTTLKEIFIEIDPVNKGLERIIESYGFTAIWENHKPQNSEYLFKKQAATRSTV
jgi:FkbM family methyltransferase